MRYVERNPLGVAAEWPWSSHVGRDAWLDPGPVPRGPGWTDFVNQPQTEAELQALRRAVNRGTPFGSPDWQQRTAAQLGLESTLRPHGRPKRIS